MSDCIFCKNLPKILENELAYAVYDINPVSRGHALVIPRRHFEQIFDATADESAAIKKLILELKPILQSKFNPDGYNIWVNCGQAAGQVVMHAHVHIIPRFKNEVLHINDHITGKH